MENIILTVANYVVIFLMGIYTISAFKVFKYNEKFRQNTIFVRQNIVMFMLHFVSYVILFIENPNEKLLIYYGLQFILILFILLMYNAIYPESSRLIINNMCMLIVIGCIFIARIGYSYATKQFLFIAVGIVISAFIPFLIEKMSVLRKLWYIYAIIDIVILLLMHMFTKTNGAHIEIKLLGFSLQPQEFIKILYVFMIASIFEKSTNIRQVIVSGLLAATHILILVWSTDLGVALIFSFIYVVMVFVATKRYFYFFTGIFGAGLAFSVGYKLFAHVKERVYIWLDPWNYYLSQGYQLVLSLFAMANGTWFGVGLGQGYSYKIPLVMSDLMIIPIIEEFGLVFSIFLILICISCFIMFLNISSVLNDIFYKLIAIGLGTGYIVQVFLTVGGSTKFIPMTGVTLPLISYGGSSMLATIIIFSIIQGIYVIYGDNKKKIGKRIRHGENTTYSR